MPTGAFCSAPGFIAGVVLAPALGLQQTDDAVVLELFADRPHQNRAHLAPPSDWILTVDKLRSVTRSLSSSSDVPHSAITVSPISVRYNGRSVASSRPNHTGHDPHRGRRRGGDPDVCADAAARRLQGPDRYQCRNRVCGSCAEYQPDAIILDLRMPLVDGLGFLRRLRAITTHTHARRSPSSPATTSSTTASRPSCAQLGAELRSSRSGSRISSSLARNLLKVTH